VETVISAFLWKRLYFFYIISKVYIFYEHILVCCGLNFIAIYDVMDSKIETIRNIHANSIESYVVIHSGHRGDTTVYRTA